MGTRSEKEAERSFSLDTMVVRITRSPETYVPAICLGTLCHPPSLVSGKWS